MDNTNLKELMEEMKRLRLDDCTKDDLLNFTEKILLFSEHLLDRIHVMDNKIQALEKKQG